MGPRFKFGNAKCCSPGDAPNHRPNVAPNCADQIVGIHTPRSLASSGPPNANLGVRP